MTPARKPAGASRPDRGWITNSPMSAAALRQADFLYQRALTVASNYPLAEKVEAHRESRDRVVRVVRRAKHALGDNT